MIPAIEYVCDLTWLGDALLAAAIIVFTCVVYLLRGWWQDRKESEHEDSTG